MFKLFLKVGSGKKFRCMVNVTFESDQVDCSIAKMHYDLLEENIRFLQHMQAGYDVEKMKEKPKHNEGDDSVTNGDKGGNGDDILVEIHL